MKQLVRSSLVLLSLSLTLSIAEANNNYQDQNFDQSSEQNLAADDSQLVQAMENKRRVNFVEGSNMTVVKILPDDNSGLTHQKWIVKLSNGKLLQAVYNTDMCPHVPLQVGDVVAMGGMFLWTGQGGLIHWLHHDPRGTRPDGYVMVNGTYYCKN